MILWSAWSAPTFWWVPRIPWRELSLRSCGVTCCGMLSSFFGGRKQQRGGKRLGSLLIKSTGSRRNSSARAMIVLGILACFSQCIALTGCSGCLRQTVVPVELNIPISDAPCGLRDDGLAHVPPRSNEFIPTAKGGSYIDPQYGCTVIRLTDARQQFH